MTNRSLRVAESNAQPALQVGWLAKGFVFVIIGLLGLEISRRGFASENADQQGALETLAQYPVGRAAVLVVSAGLLLYAVWQLWAAITQHHHDEEVDAGEVIHHLKRIGWVGLALLYALLALTGIQIALKGEQSSSSGGQGPTSPSGLADRLLELPAGQWLVGAVGLGTIAVGLYQLRKGLKQGFLDDIDTDDMADWKRSVLRVLGAAGFVARAMLMGVAGWLLLDAARQHEPDRAGGIDQSLNALAQAPGGQLLLGTCSLGLIAAGMYDMMTFRRQRIDEVE